jgi:RimJ/RimL family protein N-acetyltransferase
MRYTIRRLNPGEAEIYRIVRLDSLRESPEAFSSTYQAALDRTHESWLSQCDASASGRDRATFIVLADRPIGVAALYRDDEVPTEGELLQVWVCPSSRGGGIATELIDTVVKWAGSNGFEAIKAEVTSGNLRALKFYERYGFLRTHLDNAQARSNYILKMKLGLAPSLDSTSSVRDTEA